MVVNSINFWLFFAATLIPYFLLYKAGSKWQNVWLLIASYFFYGWADWRMLPLLAVTTLIFYGLGIAIGKNIKTNPKKASRYKTLGIIIGLGVLVYFKYLGFMVDQFATLFRSWGMDVGESTFSIVMPIGISFFTFKLMSYVMEVNLGNMAPEKDVVKFGTYVAFFPTILSGPIDRPNSFIPQLCDVRKFNEVNVSEGIKRVLWGMFLKMCIADQISGYTSAVFNNLDNHSSLTLLIATALYSFQLYSDFAGYSEMAIGVSRIMGIKVMENFDRPYFSMNIAEFWRRWHISLTSWITLYVFMPLNVAFRNFGNIGIIAATIINTVIIGAWHGANWTFILFGLYHGVLISIVSLCDKRRKKFEKKYNLKNKFWYVYSRIALTFVLWSFSLLIFQAKDISSLFQIIYIFGKGTTDLFFEPVTFIFGLPFIALVLFREWKNEHKLNIAFFHSEKAIVRFVSICALIVIILMCGNFRGGSFIYYQF